MKVFSKNGSVFPIEQAQHSLLSVEFTYGFGVYESIRVKDKKPRFLDQHITRLFASANEIQLAHTLDKAFVQKAVQDIVDAVDDETYNLKFLMIGGRTAQDATFYILPLRPSFPDRKLYKTGATAITVEYERYLPHAKSLNMLPSYLAYRDAKAAGAYDALLVNQRGEITEGTRTNFFAVDGQTLITPSLDDVLEGVTRQNVLKVATQNNFKVMEQPIKLAELDTARSYFLTSTSSKIMPLKQIDQHQLNLSDSTKQLMQLFDDFLGKS